MQNNRLLPVLMVALFLLQALIVFTAIGEDPPNPITENIDTQLIYVDETINQNSNIVILNDGDLVLSNSILNMQSTSSTTLKIEVRDGGRLTILNGSTIKANSASYGYNVEIQDGGEVIANGSTIQDFGQDGKGFLIKSDKCQITNCTITTGKNKGLYIDDCSPSIVNNTIEDIDGDGILIEGKSSPHIFDNDFIDNDVSINIQDNLYEYIIDDNPDWIDVTSNVVYISDTYCTVSSDPASSIDFALLATGTMVKYSGSTIGIWGDNGNPKYEVGAALDGDSEDDIATTTDPPVGTSGTSYFALGLNKERSINKLEIQFESTTNYLDDFEIFYYNGEELPQYGDPKWTSITSVTSNPQEPPVWNHGCSFNAKYILFEATDYNGDNRPRIKRFSLFSDEDVGSIITDPISLNDGEKWEKLIIDREISTNTDVLVSVCHQDRENGALIPFEGLESIPHTELDLGGIDPISFPEIILKVILNKEGTSSNNPKFYGFQLLNSRNILKEISWKNNISDAWDYQNTEVDPGELHLDNENDYYSHTFDHLTVGNINSQDGWTVTGSGTYCGSEVIADNHSLGGQSLAHKDLSTTGSDLVTYHDLTNSISEGIIEYDLNINEVSSTDYASISFYDSTGGSNDGIRLRYLSQSTGTPSNCLDINYLQYYGVEDSTTDWYRISDNHQMNWSNWYHLRIEFKSSKFSIFVDDVMIGKDLQPSSLTSIDRFEIKSLATAKIHIQLDELYIHESGFEIEDAYAYTHHFNLTNGESLNRIYYECLNENDSLNIDFQVISTINNINIDNNRVKKSGFIEFSNLKSLHGTIPLVVLINLHSNNTKYTPHLKRMWFEFGKVIQNNDIVCHDETNGKGILIEDSYPLYVINNTVENCCFGILIDNSTGKIPDNILEENHPFGLYIKHTDNFYINGMVFDKNTYNLNCEMASVYLSNAEISYNTTGLNGFICSGGSNLYLIDPDFTFSSNNLFDGSKIMTSHYLNLGISGLPYTRWDERQYSRVFCYRYDYATSSQVMERFEYIGDSGICLMMEKIRDATEEKTVTPNYVVIDDQNRFYITMPDPRYEYVSYGYDSDGDHIADYAEMDEGKYLYECEHLVTSDQHYENGAFQESSSGSIISYEIPVLESDPSGFEYSLAIRARYYSGTSDQGFSVELFESPDEETETFYVTSQYCWYQTNWYDLPSGETSVFVEITDENGGQEIVVDKIVLLKKEGNKPPILSSPLISDIDEDGLLDGYERTPNGYYLEAEHYPMVLIPEKHDVIDDSDAVNGKYIKDKTTNTGDLISFSLDISFEEAGSSYWVMVRAKSEGTTADGDFRISNTHGTFSKFDINITFDWHIFKYNFMFPGSQTFTLKTLSSAGTVGYDRILITKISEVRYWYNGNQNIDMSQTGTGNFILQDVPLWGVARKAVITYKSESTTSQIQGITGVNNLDVWGNMTIYVQSGTVSAYNMTNGVSYSNIGTVKTIDQQQGLYEEPSISNGEVVFSDVSNNIMYQDLRRDPNSVSTSSSVLISNDNSYSHTGEKPEIYDGTVVWKSDQYEVIYVRFLDSWHFVKIPENGQEIGTISSYLSIYDRTVVWTCKNGINSYVRMANLGIFADIQAGMKDYAGLSPYISTVISASDGTTYHQVSIYGKKIAILAGDDTNKWIEIYDLETKTSTITVTDSLLKTDSKIQLWGDYLSWQSDDPMNGGIKIKELSESNSLIVVNSVQSGFSAYGGRVYYSSGTPINCYLQDYRFSTNDDTTFYYREDLAQAKHNTLDFSQEYNEYLAEERIIATYYNEVEPTYDFTIKFSSQNLGSLDIKHVYIEIDSWTDPFCSDLDGDGLLDGEEILGYYGKSVVEIEDTIEFKEWIEPAMDKPHHKWNSFAEMYYKHSPMFNIEGVDLITGTMQYDKDENGPLYVNTSSYIKYDFPSTEKGGLYRLSLEKNYEKTQTMIDMEGLFANGPYPTKMVRGTEVDEYPSNNLNLYMVGYQPSDEELDYIKKVLDIIIRVDHSGRSSEKVKIQYESKRFELIYCNVGKVIEEPKDYYDEDDNTDMFLVVDMTYEALINYGGSPDYKIEIKCDMDLLPDKLNPEFREDLGDYSLVPESLEIERFNFIKLINMDYLTISHNGLSPIFRDTDGDQVDDATELTNHFHPLSQDSDKDGLRDDKELTIHFTNGSRRDTDGDNIRDAVEVSDMTLVTPKARGSWYERKARFSNYFDIRLIDNTDANPSKSTNPNDIDSDKDGIPDGWIDGWYYYGDFYQGIAASYYSSDHWRKGFNHDGLIQVFEGEDLNLDGSQGSSGTSWNFDGLTLEYTGDGSGESNPKSMDSDLDQIPDGYEVWYATKEPFFDGNGTLLLNPLNGGDSGNDYDIEDYIVSDYKDGTDGTYQITTTYNRYAQEIVSSSATTFKRVVRVGIRASSEVKCLEIWSGDSNGPISKIHTSYQTVDTDVDWYIFDVPDGLFKNGITTGFSYYLVIPRLESDICWYQSFTQPYSNTFRFDTGATPDPTWTSLSNLDMTYRLYVPDMTNGGDGLTNLLEYTVGTNPKDPNSDRDKWGNFDDELNDGDEVLNFKTGGNGKILMRTDIPDGAMGFKKIYNYDDLINGTLTYNEDPISNSLYDYDYESHDEEYEFDSWEYVVSFQLWGGSLVTRSYEDSTYSLIVWEERFIDFESYNEETSGTIPFAYVKFDRGSISIGSIFTPDVYYRGQDVYFSDPCRWDSDDDGLLDGEEIDWNLNSDDYTSGSSEEEKLGTDLVFNVRDIDSDNDDIIDGDEISWDMDVDGQGLDTDTLKGMIDPDSDGDGLWDGLENFPKSDNDLDNLENMIDPDSDGDGLCDGWADGFVWDPKANGNSGGFVGVSSSTTFTFVDNSTPSSPVFDFWEGEDSNCDGEKGSSETDPNNPDSDGDRLYDGFDVKDHEGNYVKGEIYIIGARTLPDYERTYVNEQSQSTDPLLDDTDTDGVKDGPEVLSIGLFKRLFIKKWGIHLRPQV